MGLRQDIGIDLGTASVEIYIKGTYLWISFFYSSVVLIFSSLKTVSKFSCLKPNEVKL